MRRNALLFTLFLTTPAYSAPNMVTLVAQDGAQREIAEQAVRQSGLLGNMLDDCAVTTIPIQMAETAGQLEVIAQSLENAVLGHYPQVAATNNIDELTYRLNQANYLDIPGVVRASAQRIAMLTTWDNCLQIQQAMPFEMQNMVAHYLLLYQPLRVELEDHVYITRPESIPSHTQACPWPYNAYPTMVDARKSPDGSKVAVVLRDGNVQIWENEHGGWRHIITHEKQPDRMGDRAVALGIPQPSTIAQWSNDSQRLAVVRHCKVYVCTKTNGCWSSTLQAFDVGAQVHDATWGNNGAILAFATAGHPVQLWEYLHDQWVCTALLGSANAGGARRVWFSPREETVCALSERDTVRVWWHHTDARLNMRKKYFSIGKALSLKAQNI